jgi:nucleoside 2-deoxyribosyltransferase
VVTPDGVTLPDGAAVTIAVNDEREGEIELTPAELAELDEAIAEADRSESVSSDIVLADLDRIARESRR